jgi:tetratricopeptide (TPR) repeat protein
MPADWYRQRAWSAAEREAFFQRLGRARKDNRAQYLYIQALELREASLPRPALDLLALALEQPVGIHGAAILSEQGRCHEALGDVEAALANYRQAVDRMSQDGQIQTFAWLDFAWLVAVRQLADRYGAAEDLLGRFAGKGGLVLPAETFRVEGSRAMMLEVADAEAAAAAARLALAAMAQSHSGVQRHPDVGLVEAVSPEVRARLERIAGVVEDGGKPRGILGWLHR